MIAYMRYDFVNSPLDFANGISQHPTRNRFSPGFQLLVRANIKVIGEYEYRWGHTLHRPEHRQYVVLPAEFVRGRHRLRLLKATMWTGNICKQGEF